MDPVKVEVDKKHAEHMQMVAYVRENPRNAVTVRTTYQVFRSAHYRELLVKIGSDDLFFENDDLVTFCANGNIFEIVERQKTILSKIIAKNKNTILINGLLEDIYANDPFYCHTYAEVINKS